ncbi:MAG: DedA family protein [Nocardioides sp.]
MVTSWLESVPSPLAYSAIGFLVFAEAAIFLGFVVPGETAVLVGGLLASTGRLSLAGVLVVVVAAAIVGDSVGYEVGRVFGPRLLRLPLLARHEGRLAGTRVRLREKGGLTVVLGRFTALLRALVPGLCGMTGMPYRRFLAYNAVGGLVWGAGVTVLAYLAGRSYQTLERSLGGVSATLLAAFVVVLLVAWHRRRRAADADEDAPGA